MKHPDPGFEKKVLLNLVEQMEDTGKTERKQTTLKRVILGLGTMGLLIAFFLAINELVHHVAVVVIAGMAGSSVGFGLFLDFAQRQWPVTRSHVDMESVRKRIDELEA